MPGLYREGGQVVNIWLVIGIAAILILGFTWTLCRAARDTKSVPDGNEEWLG